ncbi:DUF2024 family protein [Methylomonas sp. MgM2]
MKIYVFDTYVQAHDSHTMHFDVFLPENDIEKAIQFAKEWLTSVGEHDAVVTSRECRFCHFEESPDYLVDQITKQGYFIYQMEGCPG